MRLVYCIVIILCATYSILLISATQSDITVPSHQHLAHFPAGRLLERAVAGGPEPPRDAGNAKEPARVENNRPAVGAGENKPNANVNVAKPVGAAAPEPAKQQPPPQQQQQQQQAPHLPQQQQQQQVQRPVVPPGGQVPQLPPPGQKMVADTVGQKALPPNAMPTLSPGPQVPGHGTTLADHQRAQSTMQSINAAEGQQVSTGISTGLIAGLGCAGGLIAMTVGFFSYARYRRRREITSALIAKSAAEFGDSPSQREKGQVKPGNGRPKGTYTVVATYTPTLGDELEVQPGDQVTVLTEYDDGWVQGINLTRGNVKGVLPKRCLDMTGYRGGNYLAN
ncbi:uncharacterized protein VTP21DRAFT_6868 [Calcarisporiella thermophila]|uniref:uncharacterized protein n=1 Tax=Calcarisporiella thermophila TaxID=911321 RepID=UPI00374391F4